MNAHLIGYGLWVGFFIVAAIPVIVFVAFIKYSKIVADRNYLESANVDLKLRLSWHERRLEQLITDPEMVRNPRQMVLPQTMDEIPDFHVDDGFELGETIKEPTEFAVDLPFTEDQDGEQMEMEIDAETLRPFQYTPAKIEELPEGDGPDPAFLERLNTRMQGLGKLLLFPSSAAANAEPKLSWYFHDEEINSMEQAVMDIEIEEKKGYSWVVGHHFLQFQILDHHGHDLALCEIIGHGGSSMLQHPKIASLDNGDQFYASLIIRKGSGKDVQNLWTVPQQAGLFHMAEG